MWSNNPIWHIGSTLRIDSSGNVGLGTGATFHLTLSGRKTLALNGSNETAIGFQHSGNLAAFLYTSSSEFRMQSEIAIPLVFRPNNSEAMRILSDGRVAIGTDTPPATADLTVRAPNPELSLYASANFSSYLMMGDTDDYDNGYIEYDNHDVNKFMRFVTNAAERMRIESDGKIKITSGIYRGDGSIGSGIAFSSNCMIPLNHTGAADDNTEKLGASGHRWSELHAGNGTIQTSDQNLKQDIESLNDAELSVAASIKSLIKKFRMKDAVESKGDDARIHVGVIAQDVEQAFVAAGLDPRRYSLFCEDELEDGSKRFGIRYEQLLAFVISAL